LSRAFRKYLFLSFFPESFMVNIFKNIFTNYGLSVFGALGRALRPSERTLSLARRARPSDLNTQKSFF
jgi:hypothetical protein